MMTNESIRVLIVEDELSVRALADLVLTLTGYGVRTAATPKEALHILESESDIDVVLTDIVLPEMTGYDFVEEAQRISPGLRVVFMSGHASDYVRRGGHDRFLAKPFTVESLRTVIRAAMAA